MDTNERVIAVLDLFIEATGESSKTVSRHALRHSSKLQALKEGQGLSARSADYALTWAFDNWPNDRLKPAILSDWAKVCLSTGLQGGADYSSEMLSEAAISGD